MKKETQPYLGLEIGPIRPPSEANSLMLRVTRNCSWNKCTFCGLYKGEKFSLRPCEHVLEDIRTVKDRVDAIQSGNRASPQDWAYHSAKNWIESGMESVFLQDANSMITPTKDLIRIIRELKSQFPQINRITSYARSKTIVRISDDTLKEIADAGVNRIHIGLETASDIILDLVKKGTDKATQILAGQKVKAAGIELSEYYMPGLGGLEYLEENALETADALRQINPDFIRIRTLALPDDTPLKADYDAGLFVRSSDVDVAKELRMMIQNLCGVTSEIKSDHILNLLPEVDGKLPQDQGAILKIIDDFLNLLPQDKIVYRLGRRLAYFQSIADLDNQFVRQKIEHIIRDEGINSDNIDSITDQLMKRFI